MTLTTLTKPSPSVDCFNVTCFNFLMPKGKFEILKSDNMFFLVEKDLNPNEMFLSDQSVIWNTWYRPYKVLNIISSNND
jgi:hypothetical protein